MRKDEGGEGTGGTLQSTVGIFVLGSSRSCYPYPLLLLLPPRVPTSRPWCSMSSALVPSLDGTAEIPTKPAPKSRTRPIRLTIAITPKEAELLGRLRIHFDRMDAKVGNGSHCTGIKSSLPDLIRRIIRVYGVDNAGLIWAAVEQASADVPAGALDTLPPLEGDARALANRALIQMAQARGVPVSP